MDTAPTAHATTTPQQQPDRQVQKPDSQSSLPPLQQQHSSSTMPRSDYSVSSTASSTDTGRPPLDNGGATEIISPVPTRPGLPKRRSSGTIIVPRDSAEATRPVETYIDPGDVRAMSPRRTTEDIEQLGQQTRAEMQKHAKMLQESLLTIFHRIQAVKEEHDKLDNNNKFLQKYIGDLMVTSKITASGSGGRGSK